MSTPDLDYLRHIKRLQRWNKLAYAGELDELFSQLPQDEYLGLPAVPALATAGWATLGYGFRAHWAPSIESYADQTLALFGLRAYRRGAAGPWAGEGLHLVFEDEVVRACQSLPAWAEEHGVESRRFESADDVCAFAASRAVLRMHWSTETVSGEDFLADVLGVRSYEQLLDYAQAQNKRYLLVHPEGGPTLTVPRDCMERALVEPGNPPSPGLPADIDWACFSADVSRTVRESIDGLPEDPGPVPF